MIKSLIRFSLKFCKLIFAVFFLFFSFDVQVNALTTKHNDQLIERIAKDFSRKFCNGVGFGLSQESAVNFAMKENIATFKNKKGIEGIDTKAINDKVTTSVVEQCGYSLTLKVDEWGKTFNNVDKD